MTTIEFPSLLKTTVSSPAQGILKVLAYFDLFQYPLNADELRFFYSRPVSADTIESALKELLAEKRIFSCLGFYLLKDDPMLVYRRMQGNQRAAGLLQRASRIARALHHIPFVRGIGISGSLSKNFADKRSDIDYFIITKSNRLWIARTLMHVVKKLSFLAGRQHWFCMNYYIDETAMEIPERNIYTATEIKTLIPITGQYEFQLFAATNAWTSNFLPNHHSYSVFTDKTADSWIKRGIEFCLSGNVGNWIDNLLHRITRIRWQKKSMKGRKNIKGLPVGLLTDKHFAKSNPGAFQERLLAAYEEKVRSIL